MRILFRSKLQSTFCIAVVGFVCSYASGAVASPELSATDIIRKSAAANAADWKAQVHFGYRERTETAKLDSTGEIRSRQVKTYEVLMIEGSPYERLEAVNGKPLSGQQQRDEQQKLKHEIEVRQKESPEQRENRLSKFHKNRAEERLLMQQMVRAFKFKLDGEQQVNGVGCYVLDATPDPTYQPPVEKARVLAGMKGKLYIDKAGYHWVKVEADVISPVDFGFFIAKVKPGTSFELVQAPVGNVWLPKQFTQNVDASILGFYGMRNRERDTYSDYHRAMLTADARPSK